MKDIKFRAKRIDNGKWVEGYYSYSGIVNRNFILILRGTCAVPPHHWMFDNIEIDKNTLCQYTGLLACWNAFDNEPQEQDVWEHDLLEVKYEGKRVIAEVRYESGMYILSSNVFADSYIPLFDVTEIEDGCVYVNAEHKGNIFDNPELINA